MHFNCSSIAFTTAQNATLQVDHFGHHGTQNFGAGDLSSKKASLNQKSWLPNGDRAKTLTCRVGMGHSFTYYQFHLQHILKEFLFDYCFVVLYLSVRWNPGKSSLVFSVFTTFRKVRYKKCRMI